MITRPCKTTINIYYDCESIEPYKCYIRDEESLKLIHQFEGSTRSNEEFETFLVIEFIDNLFELLQEIKIPKTKIKTKFFIIIWVLKFLTIATFP
jgi:hypothetical protein